MSNLNQRNLCKTYVHSSTRFVEKRIFLETHAHLYYPTIIVRLVGRRFNYIFIFNSTNGTTAWLSVTTDCYRGSGSGWLPHTATISQVTNHTFIHDKFIIFLIFLTNNRHNDLTPQIPFYVLRKRYNFISVWMRFVDKDLSQGHIYFCRCFSIFTQVTLIHNYALLSVPHQHVILHPLFCQYPIIFGKIVRLLHLRTFSNILWFVPPTTVPVPNENCYSSPVISQFPLDDCYCASFIALNNVWYYSSKISVCYSLLFVF